GSLEHLCVEMTVPVEVLPESAATVETIPITPPPASHDEQPVDPMVERATEDGGMMELRVHAPGAADEAEEHKATGSKPPDTEVDLREGSQRKRRRLHTGPAAVDSEGKSPGTV
ncbi:hypothetical protein CYMTET_36553, partial [Cymbomonas tetramitiformis]